MPQDGLKLPVKGSLLLASPLISDGIFDRAAILLIDHNPEKGTLGFLLNQPTGKTVGETLAEENLPRELRYVEIFLGGPVEQEKIVFAAFSRQDGQLMYKTHISMEQAVEFGRQPGTIIRAFNGHAGWTAGQLEQELEQMTWIRTSAPASLLDYAPGEDVWKEVLRHVSPYHAILAEASRKPFLN